MVNDKLPGDGHAFQRSAGSGRWHRGDLFVAKLDLQMGGEWYRLTGPVTALTTPGASRCTVSGKRLCPPVSTQSLRTFPTRKRHAAWKFWRNAGYIYLANLDPAGSQPDFPPLT